MLRHSYVLNKENHSAFFDSISVHLTQSPFSYPNPSSNQQISMATVQLCVHQGWDSRDNSSFPGGHRQDIFKTVLIESCQTQTTHNKNGYAGA